MKEITYGEQQAYTASVEESMSIDMTTSDPVVKDLMNPDAPDSLEVETEGYLQYSREQVDETRPNAHNWHGWANEDVVGLEGFGGAVRTVLLSGSTAELRALKVDSGIEAETLESTWDTKVGHNLYVRNDTGINGTLVISENADDPNYLDDISNDIGIYVDETKEKNYISHLDVDEFGAESGSFDDLTVQDLHVTHSLTVTGSTILSGSTAVTGNFGVDGPAFFETLSVFRQDVQVEGNLYVEGTATYINTEDLYVEDKSITIASGSPTPASADGAGFDIDGAGVTFHYNAQTDQMDLNKGLYVDGDVTASGVITAPSGAFESASIQDLTSENTYINHLTASTIYAPVVSGSFVGDGSGLTGVTMSVSDAPKCKHVINIQPGESETITHPFKTQNVLVQVYKWADPTYQPEYQEMDTEAGTLEGGEDEVPQVNWDEPAIQVFDAQITVRGVNDPNAQDPYCVEISYPTELHGYVVIADAGLYVSGSGFVDIVEATRETHWFGDDGGLNIIPSGSSETEVIEKGMSYKFQHSLATKNILVQVYKYYPRVDENQQVTGWTPVQIYPEFVAINDINEVEIKFSTDPEEGEDSEMPQYFGYIVLAKAGSVVKNFSITGEDIEEFQIHYGNSGSWSAREYDIEIAHIESASLGEATADRLTVDEYIDTPKIGNLNTGEQYYHDYYAKQLWGSYMEFTDLGIVSYVRNEGKQTEYEDGDPYTEEQVTVIPTASLLDGEGNLHLRGALFTNETFTTSDEREKNNIRTLENAVDDLNKLRGVRFEWNNNGKPGIGVVAQEVQAIYPELTREVTKFNGEKRLTVNYDGLIGVLIEAVKTLSQKVEELENKISNNENR